MSLCLFCNSLGSKGSLGVWMHVLVPPASLHHLREGPKIQNCKARLKKAFVYCIFYRKNFPWDVIGLKHNDTPSRHLFHCLNCNAISNMNIFTLKNMNDGPEEKGTGVFWRTILLVEWAEFQEHIMVKRDFIQSCASVVSEIVPSQFAQDRVSKAEKSKVINQCMQFCILCHEFDIWCWKLCLTWV